MCQLFLGSLIHPLLEVHCWARQICGLSFSQSRIQIIFCTLGSRVILSGASTTCTVMQGQESWTKMIPLLKRDAQSSGVQLLLLAAEAMTKGVKHCMTPFSSVCVCFFFFVFFFFRKQIHCTEAQQPLSKT